MPSIDSSAIADSPSSRESLVKILGVRDGIAIVVGTVIGSGIFLVPGPIARQLPTLTLVLLVWITGGVLSLFGSLSLGELAATYPGAGGLYIYLRHIYGRPLAFLYGWALFSLIQSGSIATLASGFALYVSKITPLTAFEFKALPIVCILFFSLVNLFGIRFARMVQNAGALSKVAGIALVFGLLISHGHTSLLRMTLPAKPSGSMFLEFGTALVAVLWAYEGWHVVSFTAGEFRSPARDLPRSLFWGTLIVTSIYLLLTVAYYAVLTSARVSASSSAASAAIQAAWGDGAMLLISVVILTSILGSTNGMILTAPRVYYAMARDGVFLAKFGEVSKRFRVPVFAIATQAVWASALTLIGSFQQLFTYVVFTAWIFYGLTVAGVIILRRRRGAPSASFQTPAYPWVPIAFVIAAAGIAVSTIVADPLHAAFGIGMVLLGIPLYLLFRRTDKDVVEEPTVLSQAEQ
jgi:APA family basic amino acid/polyamine antiporter